MILPVRHDQIQDGCQIEPHGTLFRHFNIYNFLLDNICFQKKLVSLNIPGGAREAPYSTRLFVIGDLYWFCADGSHIWLLVRDSIIKIA